MFNKNNSKDKLHISNTSNNARNLKTDHSYQKEEKIDKEDLLRSDSLKKDTNQKLNSNIDVPEIEILDIGANKNEENLKMISDKKEIKENKNFNTKTNKRQTRMNTNSIFSKSKLRVIPLGGLNEVGKNMTAIEYENDIIVIDCGLTFPEDEMLGVDIVIPDITYLEKNKDKVKALLITHGHEDHIGAVPYFLKKINVPVYATKLTLGLITNKLQEHRLEKSTTLKCVKTRDPFNIGKFKIEFIHVTHSIADSTAIAVTTPVGTVVATGDFKVDFTPINEEVMDFERFVELGRQGVLLLMSDSTNVLRPGYTMSERTVGEEFDRIFMNCKKRIIVATFSSNIHRIQQIINSAVKYDRKIALVGRSMVNVMGVAVDLGYLKAPEGTIIDIDKIGLYNPEQLVIITTGSQGEPMSALVRMSTGEHKKVNITPDDLVIFSSSAIPGNEKSIGKVTDELEKLGAEIIYNQLADVHVSGHACQEELKLMLSLVKPKFFMPIHGEYRFLKKHAEIAQSLGIPKENIFISSNGKPLELTKDSAKLVAQVPSGVVLVDGLGVGDVGNIVIRDRQMLSENGMIIIVVTLDRKTLRVVAGPDIVTRGFVYVRENETLMDQIKELAKEELLECEKNRISDWSTIKSNVRDRLEEFVYSKTKRQPMILPIIMEVSAQSSYNNLNNLISKEIESK